MTDLASGTINSLLHELRLAGLSQGDRRFSLPKGLAYPFPFDPDGSNARSQAAPVEKRSWTTASPQVEQLGLQPARQAIAGKVVLRSRSRPEAGLGRTLKVWIEESNHVPSFPQ
jgi:hypothetical protein